MSFELGWFLAMLHLNTFCVLIRYLLPKSQRDTTGLTAENKELKLRLQAMEQQAHLRDGMFSYD